MVRAQRVFSSSLHPNRRSISRWCSIRTLTVPVPTVPSPMRPMRMVRLCESATMISPGFGVRGSGFAKKNLRCAFFRTPKRLTPNPGSSSANPEPRIPNPLPLCQPRIPKPDLRLPPKLHQCAAGDEFLIRTHAQRLDMPEAIAVGEDHGERVSQLAVEHQVRRGQIKVLLRADGDIAADEPAVEIK